MMTQFERIRKEVEDYSAPDTSSFKTSSSLRAGLVDGFPTPESSEWQSERMNREKQGGDLT